MQDDIYPEHRIRAAELIAEPELHRQLSASDIAWLYSVDEEFALIGRPYPKTKIERRIVERIISGACAAGKLPGALARHQKPRRHFPPGFIYSIGDRGASHEWRDPEWTVEVDDFARWAEMPPPAEGPDGDLVRAWLSLAAPAAESAPDTGVGADLRRRVEIIAAELSKDHADLMSLPYGAKARLMHRLLSKMPGEFTSEPTFNAAWTEGSKTGRFGITGKDRYKPRDER